MKFDVNKIPKLPYGEGTISIFNDEKLIYKKSIKVDGQSIRVSVYGKTPKECMTNMRLKESEIRDKKHKSDAIKNQDNLLADELNKWLDNVKQLELKPQSFRRLKSTIKRINNSSIGHYSYTSVTTDDIQAFITSLNEVELLSFSTIKKIYDCLNEFFRYVSAKNDIKNPMLLVKMPKRDNVITTTKQISFFEQDDIDKFIAECDTRNLSGKPKYKYGYALAANIYMGMRAGELLAIQWKDIDFDKRTVYVAKTVIESLNPDYDEQNVELMKEMNIPKYINAVQNSTKRSKNRYVPLNTKAKDLLLKHKETCDFTKPDDFIIMTSNKNLCSIDTLSKTIENIEKAACTKVQSKGTHLLRHTCASLYFKANVPVETICQILGNTREVCETTYIHFIEEQLKEAASKIDVIEI